MKGRFWLSVLVVFVAYTIIEFILHTQILSGAYEATKELWRPEEEMNQMMGIMWIGTLVFSFFFVFLFSKGYEGKGIGEGLRFGFYIGLMFAVPMALATYSCMPVTGGLAAAWLIGGVVENIVAGVLLSLVYKPKPAVA